MASKRGKGKDGKVTDADLKAVEYELMRKKRLEENERRLAVVRQKKVALTEEIEARQPQKQKRKAPSCSLETTNERRVLRSSGAKDSDNAVL